MAQRTEKEETEFKVVPDTISLCVQCGLPANSSTPNTLCHKCFHLASTSSSSPATQKSFRSSNKHPRSSPERTSENNNRDLRVEDVDLMPPTKRPLNRCFGCRRKVGLTGFRCRCGDLFCADHRYTDRHDCTYDYKSAGREAIARENPVVKAAKIIKI